MPVYLADFVGAEMDITCYKLVYWGIKIGCDTVPSAQDAYLQWLKTTGVNAGEIKSCVNCSSEEIILPILFPFGNRRHHSIYVS